MDYRLGDDRTGIVRYKRHYRIDEDWVVRNPRGSLPGHIVVKDEWKAVFLGLYWTVTSTQETFIDLDVTDPDETWMQTLHLRKI